MKAATVLLTAILWSGAARAGTINLDSRQGLFTSFAGVTTVAITPNPNWQANYAVNPGDVNDRSAVWISYADTGWGGTHFQPQMGTTGVVTIFDTFQSGAGTLLLHVWADDTATVLLDGNLLMPGVFTQNTCSGQPIGCRPQDAGNISTSIAAGKHTLSFVLYQVGTGQDTSSNPFGLLFTGTAPGVIGPNDGPGSPESSVPETGTLALLASGMAGLAWLRLHRA